MADDDQPELPGVDLGELMLRDPVGTLRPVPPIVRLEKKLSFMWGKHGAGPDGRKCKDCVRCGYVQYSKRYYKCSAYGNTHGPGTDWRANWPACGIFIEKEKP
jgi:hypothetical protein